MKQLTSLIWEIATEILGDEPDTGGCAPFCSPEEWKKRGEEYGEGAKLIVVHDGGDLASLFNWAYGNYPFVNEMSEALEKHGYFAEQLNSWSTGIYERGE